jgi:hypothetical protein
MTMRVNSVRNGTDRVKLTTPWLGLSGVASETLAPRRSMRVSGL